MIELGQIAEGCLQPILGGSLISGAIVNIEIFFEFEKADEWNG
jgi:hypothetical protein